MRTSATESAADVPRMATAASTWRKHCQLASRSQPASQLGSRGRRLVDAHQVAGRVTHSAVPRAPRLLDRLLDYIGSRGAHLLEDEVEVIGAEVDAVEGSLGEQRGDDVSVGRTAALIVREDDRDVWLGSRADGRPPEPFITDVIAQFQAEYVAIKGQREVRVMDEDEAAGNG